MFPSLHRACPLALRAALGLGLAASALTSTRPTAAQTALVPPKLVKAPPVEWPGEPGAESVRIRLTIVVTVDGGVGDVEVAPDQDADLAAAAIDNVKLWRFEAATRDGQAVAAKIQVEVVFEAKAEEPAAAPVAPAEPEPAPAPETAEPQKSEATADDDETPAPAPAPPQEVRVSGRRAAPPPRSASDFVVDVGQLRDVPRRSSEQLLTLAPGFFLTNHGGEGHPSAIFLRGFDAAEGQDIEFSVDGVPINSPSNAHGHGYADTLFVIPELVQRLRVVEGPFDPRQGDFAVAGSAQYSLGLEHRGILAQAGYGSFDAKRALILWGPQGASERTFAGADFREGDGFGPNRAYRMARFQGQWEHRLSDTSRLLLGAAGYATRYDSAGVVRGDDFNARRIDDCAGDRDSQFYCYYDPNQGGAAQRWSMNARLEHLDSDHAYEQQLFFASYNMRLRENLTGFITDIAGGGEQRGDGVEQVYDTSTVGARGHYRQFYDWLQHRQEAEIGYLVRRDSGRTRQRRLRRSGGVPYRTDFENEIHITNVAGYIAGRFRPSRWFGFTGGVRIDSFVFAVEDLNQPELDRQGEREPTDSSEAFGFAIQPRVSADVTLVRAPKWLLSSVTSYGRGSRSSDAQALSDGEFAPFARVEAAETGLLFTYKQPRQLELTSRIVAFFTRVNRDLVFDETLGRNVLAGKSNRFGGLASSRVTAPAAGIDAQGSVTYAEAHLTPEGADFFDLTAGPRLPYIPRWVTRVDLSVRRPLELLGQRFEYRGALGMSHVAARPLPLEQFGRPFFVVDASAGLRWKPVELGFEVTNLLDRRNRSAEFNYPSNFSSPDAPASQLAAYHFAGAPPRQFMGTLTLYIDAPQAQHSLKESSL